MQELDPGRTGQHRELSGCPGSTSPSGTCCRSARRRSRTSACTSPGCHTGPSACTGRYDRSRTGPRSSCSG